MGRLIPLKTDGEQIIVMLLAAKLVFRSVKFKNKMMLILRKICLSKNTFIALTSSHDMLYSHKTERHLDVTLITQNDYY